MATFPQKGSHASNELYLNRFDKMWFSKTVFSCIRTMGIYLKTAFIWSVSTNICNINRNQKAKKILIDHFSGAPFILLSFSVLIFLYAVYVYVDFELKFCFLLWENYLFLSLCEILFHNTSQEPEYLGGLTMSSTDLCFNFGLEKAQSW